MLYSEDIKSKARVWLQQLSLREKIGQCVQFNDGIFTRLQSQMGMAEIAERYPFGSFFSGMDIINRFGSKSCGNEALSAYAGMSKLPLLISGDLEQGAGEYMLPNQIVVAATEDPSLAYDYGRVIAQRGSYRGFNWTFAPVTDIILNWLAPAVGVRSFGANPEKVAAFAEQVIKGMQDHGLCATAKHFPGDGVDFRNQHLGVATDNRSKAEWDATCGLVYRRVINAGVRAIMAAHLALPCVDDTGMPSVLSRKLCTDLLRRELGFQGVVVSDALTMSGFVSYRPYEKRMICQFNAGIDVMLWPEPDIFDLFEKAVEYGDISMERLDEAALRVLEMKLGAGLMDKNAAPKEDAADYDEVGRKIAEKGTVLVRDRNKVLPLDKDKVRRVLLYIADPKQDYRKPSEEDARFKFIIEGLRQHGVTEIQLAAGENCEYLWKLEQAGERFDAVLVIYTNSADYSIRIVSAAQEASWLMTYTAFHTPIAISQYSPYVATENPVGPAAVINACSECPASQQAVVKLLYGELEFQGKSPVPLYAEEHSLDAWDKMEYMSLK